MEKFNMYDNDSDVTFSRPKKYKTYNNSKNKFSSKNNIMQYQGSFNIPAFQINRFKDVVSLRFNIEFITEVLELYDKSKTSVTISSLLKDIGDLLNAVENECYVSEYYHVGKISSCIYINMNNKFCDMLFEFFNSLSSFPPHILAFKQRLEKMSVQGKMHDTEWND